MSEIEMLVPDPIPPLTYPDCIRKTHVITLSEVLTNGSDRSSGDGGEENDT